MKIMHFIILVVLIMTLTRKRWYALLRQEMDRALKIEFLAFVILVGFFVAVVFHYMLAYYWGATSPRNSFILYVLSGQFGDLNVSLLQDKSFAPYDESLGDLKAQYFPFTYVLIYPLTFLDRESAIITYSLFFIASMFVFVRQYFMMNVRPTLELIIANYKNIFIISFLSYPFLFSIERGNLENILFILVALSLYFYTKQMRVLCSICLAMAASMKLYPLFFIVYFVSEKRYFESILTIILFFVLTLGSLALFHSGFHQSLIGWRTALTGMGNYILFLPDSCTRYNLGLWGLTKTIGAHFHMTVPLKTVSIWYHFFVAFMLVAVVSCIIFVEKLPWRKLALVVLSILLFPEMSNDYKLLLILLPLAAFINDKPKQFDFLFIILFVLLMIPKNYYWVQNDISVSNLLNPTIMLLMMATIMVSGIVQKFSTRDRA
jgi:hypothetical protein